MDSDKTNEKPNEKSNEMIKVYLRLRPTGGKPNHISKPYI
jgi:hypothetical protein